MAETPSRALDLLHHGDAELAPGLVDLAVNVFPGPPPPWLVEALHASIAHSGAYPDPRAAEAALTRHHHRPPGHVLATAGAAEAFTLIARWRAWRRPVVVHPQFTEPHAALLHAGHRVSEVLLPPPFALDPALVPDDADLVILGNPTNPTGVLHRPHTIRALLRPGRVVVVDEAFMDVVPGETGSLSTATDAGLVVIRSLTKHWGIPGVRAGYLLAEPTSVCELRRLQIPWSVSAQALAAMSAVATPRATQAAARRTRHLVEWRRHLEQALADLGVEHVPSSASFVLARPGAGVHARLRTAGIAVRRCDTFPGLDDAWVRLAVRPPETTDVLIRQLRSIL